jgi:hypothetical protein
MNFERARPRPAVPYCPVEPGPLSSPQAARYSQRSSPKGGSIRFVSKCCKPDTIGDEVSRRQQITTVERDSVLTWSCTRLHHPTPRVGPSFQSRPPEYRRKLGPLELSETLLALFSATVKVQMINEAAYASRHQSLFGWHERCFNFLARPDEHGPDLSSQTL